MDLLMEVTYNIHDPRDHQLVTSLLLF